MLASEDGRHLVMMPHLERSTFPWNWGHYPEDRKDQVSPWTMVFENAYSWLAKKINKFYSFHYLRLSQTKKMKANNETNKTI